MLDLYENKFRGYGSDYCYADGRGYRDGSGHNFVRGNGFGDGCGNGDGDCSVNSSSNIPWSLTC